MGRTENRDVTMSARAKKALIVGDKRSRLHNRCVTASKRRLQQQMARRIRGRQQHITNEDHNQNDSDHNEGSDHQEDPNLKQNDNEDSDHQADLNLEQNDNEDAGHQEDPNLDQNDNEDSDHQEDPNLDHEDLGCQEDSRQLDDAGVHEDVGGEDPTYHDELGDDEEEDQVHHNDPVPHEDASEEDIEEEDSFPYPGGPEVKDLLLSYKYHIAHDIWKGKDRGLLKIQQRVKYLKNWVYKGVNDSPEQGWTRFVVQSGLNVLHDVHFKHIDFPIIFAFVERWHPETNSFHLPWGEMTITLHDVNMLIGLTVDGESLIDPNPSMTRDELAQLLSDMFGLDTKYVCASIARGGVKFKDLDKACKDKERKLAHPDIVASGYLLYLIGATLFTNKSQSMVKAEYIRLLLVHHRTNQYAWGVGALAYLYREMGKASRVNCKQLACCSSLLQVDYLKINHQISQRKS